MARASKWFPYGYGPATNGRFVVEEVGEVDDDEEEYGDYQELRGEGSDEGDKTNSDLWSWVKAAEVEEAEEDAAFEEKCRRKHGQGNGENWKERHSKASEYQLAYAPSWDNIPDPVVLGHESRDDEDEGESDEEEGFGLERLLI